MTEQTRQLLLPELQIKMQRLTARLVIVFLITSIVVYGLFVLVPSIRKEPSFDWFDVTTTGHSTEKYQPVMSCLEEKCGEKHHVALLKVHKTGSSTVQNIFLRFADSRNLSLVLGHDKKSLMESGFPNVISYKNSLLPSNVVPPPKERKFNMLCCHVIYNRTQFETYLPKYTSYIGIVREPFSRTESAISYFNKFRDISLSTFASNPLKYARDQPSMVNNRMAFEFGFPLELFPNYGDNFNNYKNLKRQIDEYLLKLYKEFDLILVNEYMAESLVLMKKLLGWDMKDIIYVNLNVAKSKPRTFVSLDRVKLIPYLYLDIELYEFAVKLFWSKVARAGDDFKDEVEHFIEVKEDVSDFCKHTSTIDSFEVKKSKWNKRFTVTKKDCDLYSTRETKYIQRLRYKQYGELNN